MRISVNGRFHAVMLNCVARNCRQVDEATMIGAEFGALNDETRRRRVRETCIRFRVRESGGCHGCQRSGLRQRLDEFACIDDAVSVCRPVQLVGGVHHFAPERRRSILDERHVVSEFRCVSRGSLDTGVRQQTHYHDVRDAMLFQLKVEVSIGKTARAPMLVHDDVA